MQESLTIQPSTPADANDVIAGINYICAEGGAFYTKQFIPSQRWRQVLCEPKDVADHLLLVARSGDRFAGSCRLFPGLSHSYCYHVLELGIFILPEYRRQGIGTRLLLSGIEWATQNGFEKITLGVFASNLPAIRFYKKLSFLEEGNQRRQNKIDNQYVDLLLMARFLTPQD